MTTHLDPPERVRLRLKQWIDTTGIGQRELAADLGKTQVWLQKVLAGENHVRLRDLDAVAHALRTTAAELVRGTEERYQLELTPSEVRVVERLRRRKELMDGLLTLLELNGPAVTPKERPSAPKRNKVGRPLSQQRRVNGE